MFIFYTMSSTVMSTDWDKHGSTMSLTRHIQHLSDVLIKKHFEKRMAYAMIKPGTRQHYLNKCVIHEKTLSQ